ncbi:MAG: hypothetical protein U0744_05370 [Gemmataceae bacterium]
MVKCPFCGFDNEDGALFCEQCKSDLSSVSRSLAPAEPIPVAFAEAIPVRQFLLKRCRSKRRWSVPVEAIAVEAVFVEAVPVEAVPAEAVPVEAVLQFTT